jgi:hypothetical protein
MQPKISNCCCWYCFWDIRFFPGTPRTHAYDPHIHKLYFTLYTFEKLIPCSLVPCDFPLKLLQSFFPRLYVTYPFHHNSVHLITIITLNTEYSRNVNVTFHIWHSTMQKTTAKNLTVRWPTSTLKKLLHNKRKIHKMPWCYESRNMCKFPHLRAARFSQWWRSILGSSVS